VFRNVLNVPWDPMSKYGKRVMMDPSSPSRMVSVPKRMLKKCWGWSKRRYTFIYIRYINNVISMLKTMKYRTRIVSFDGVDFLVLYHLFKLLP
jgi:hypothetical protein